MAMLFPTKPGFRPTNTLKNRQKPWDPWFFLYWFIGFYHVFNLKQKRPTKQPPASCSKPVLKNSQLEQKAGMIEAVFRKAPAIKVASRSRTCKTRCELVKSMNKLSITPNKLKTDGVKGTSSCPLSFGIEKGIIFHRGHQ